MNGVTWEYRPLSVYAPFHASAARERLLAGGFGSGKTVALCADAVSAGLQVPGARILLCRKTVPEVRDTLEPEFLAVLPPEVVAKTRRSGGHIESITLHNGTIYYFRSIDDWQKHKSLNLARIYWDELSEFDIATYTGMLGRLRQRWPTAEARRAGYKDEIPAWFRGSAASTNPDGHGWIWHRFINPQERTDERASWTATSLDNPHLPEDYLKNLLDFPPAWVRRYVLASWDEFGGLVYPDWRYDSHVVTSPVTLSRTTPIWMGFDPGSRHPTAILWCAVIGRDLVALAEEKASDTGVLKWAEKMRAVEKNLPPVQWRVGDPNSMHVRDRGTQVSLWEQYRREGFRFDNGPSRHEDRIPMLGTLITQGRFKATAACPMLIDQISTYKWEDLTSSMRSRLGQHADDYGPEKPVKVNDDLVDCAQYLSSRWVRGPKKQLAPDTRRMTRWQRESRDIHQALQRHRQRGAQYRPAAGTLS